MAVYTVQNRLSGSMKICFFSDIHILGGGELWVLNASLQLLKSGHKVCVICPWRSPLHGQCQEAGIEVFCYFRMEGLPVYEPIYHFLEQHRFDVLYCTIIGGFCESVVLETMVNRINRSAGRPKMALVLKTGLPPMTGMGPQYYGIGSGPAVARLHVVSDLNRRAFINWLNQSYVDFDESYIETVREGTDLSRFRDKAAVQSNERRLLEIADDDQVVTCLARLHKMKGQEYLLRAIPGVLHKHPQTLFLIAGEGEDRARLEALRDELGLHVHVRFLGHVQDVPALLAVTDVLCHPSLADGVPNAIVEAMAMGIPVLASNVGGISEVVRDGECGFLVQPQDVSNITSRLNHMLYSEDVRHAYALRGQEIIRKHFDLAKNIEYLVSRLEADVQAVRHDHSSTTKSVKTGAANPIPVLFVMNSLRTGGEESELKILARYLDRIRFPIFVLSLFEVGENAPAVADIHASGVTIDTACHGMASENEKVSYLVDKIRRERIRVVVACQDTRLAYQAFTHLSPDECRLIEHGGIVEEVSSIPKHYTEYYIGVSRKIQQAAAAYMRDPGRAIFIPSMVDTREFENLHRPELRVAYGFPPDATIVIFVGRIDPKKRIEDILCVAADLIPDYPQLLFLIAGGADAFNPEYFKQLLIAGKMLIDTKRLLFIGTRSDVPTLLSAADILVLPGAGEGMSHVISEAGCAGLAVIAADDGAAREQLDDGKGGYIVPVAQPDVFRKTLVALIEDPDARAVVGAHLQAKVKAEYSAQAIIPQWQSLLEKTGQPISDAHDLYIHNWDREMDFPAEIQIQTITSCNASCVMCPYPQVSKEFPHGRMTEELYARILDECALETGLRRIEPFLMNEAFTDKRIVELIHQAKRQVPHAMVTLTTNGSPMVPRVCDRLVHSGLDAIWFSFNGANPETYEQIMGISYEQVKRNIDYLLKIRPPTLQVYVNMIETGLMAPEIEQNIRYWQQRGVQAGSSPLVNRAGNVTNFSELNYQPISNRPVRVCELPFYKMYIIYNGDVVLCCMDWRRKVVLGNVAQQSIRDIWNGPEYRRIRRLHIEGHDAEIELCSNCSYTLR